MGLLVWEGSHVDLRVDKILIAHLHICTCILGPGETACLSPVPFKSLFLRGRHIFGITESSGRSEYALRSDRMHGSRGTKDRWRIGILGRDLVRRNRLNERSVKCKDVSESWVEECIDAPGWLGKRERFLPLLFTFHPDHSSCLLLTFSWLLFPLPMQRVPDLSILSRSIHPSIASL